MRDPTQMQDAVRFEPSEAQRAAMASDGFLVVRGFFGPDAVADIRTWTEELAAAPEISGRHWVYHEESLTDPRRRLVQRIENFCPFHEGFDRLVREGALPGWVGALMGGPALLFKEKINFKMPGGPGFKLHQDQQAGWTRYAPLFVTAMVTIDGTTLENGCLEIAAGRHREGLLGEEWRPMAEDALALQPLPTEPGDVIFFDSFVPHASKPNYTNEPRRVLYLTYNLARYGDQRPRYYADKHAAFPPDIDRDSTRSYVFRV